MSPERCAKNGLSKIFPDLSRLSGDIAAMLARVISMLRLKALLYWPTMSITSFRGRQPESEMCGTTLCIYIYKR